MLCLSISLFYSDDVVRSVISRLLDRLMCRRLSFVLSIVIGVIKNGNLSGFRRSYSAVHYYRDHFCCLSVHVVIIVCATVAIVSDLHCSVIVFILRSLLYVSYC